MQLTPTYNVIRNHHVVERTVNSKYTDSFKVKLIVDALCEYSTYKRDLLLSESRFREIAEIRQIGMTIAKKNTSFGLQKIATKFNRKHHTTVLHAVNAVTNLCETDKKFLNKTRVIQTMIEKHFVLTHKF